MLFVLAEWWSTLRVVEKIAVFVVSWLIVAGLIALGLGWLIREGQKDWEKEEADIKIDGDEHGRIINENNRVTVYRAGKLGPYFGDPTVTSCKDIRGDEPEY